MSLNPTPPQNQKKLALEAIVPDECAGKRLDQALQELFPDYSRTILQEWLKKQWIQIDGKSLRAKDKVKGGEHISIHAAIAIQTASEPENIPLSIVYEDDDILIINKPVGLVTHPGAGNQTHTLVNALLHHAPTLSTLPRAGIIHRLDKNTSGLLVIAKTLEAHTFLVRALQARDIHREYDAIVNGILISGGTIDKAIGRHPTLRTKMAVTEQGKEAITHFRIQEKFRVHTWIRVVLETGRTHQIRVHMAHSGHSLVGDPEYSRLQFPKNASEELKHCLREFKHQALHARCLELTHPRSGKLLKFEAPLPDDMKNLIEILRIDNKKK